MKKLIVMKRYALIFALIAASFSFAGCEDVSDEMTSGYPSDYTINYGIRQVMQYDPMNINGIDVAGKFEFFNTLRFVIHVEDNKMVRLSFSNGDVPFSPFGFDLPEGEVECELNTDALPNELRVKGTGKVIAYFQNGEFSIPFRLDSKSLSYKYTFKSVK